MLATVKSRVVRVCLLPPSSGLKSSLRKNSPAMSLCLTELANAMGSGRIRQLAVYRYISGDSAAFIMSFAR